MINVITNESGPGAMRPQSATSCHNTMAIVVLRRHVTSGELRPGSSSVFLLNMRNCHSNKSSYLVQVSHVYVATLVHRPQHVNRVT